MLGKRLFLMGETSWVKWKGRDSSSGREGRDDRSDPGEEGRTGIQSRGGKSGLGW